MAARLSSSRATSPPFAAPRSTCKARPARSSAPIGRSPSSTSSRVAGTWPRRRTTRRRPPSSCSRAMRAVTESARRACHRPSSSPSPFTETSPITCTSASRWPSRRPRYGESSACSRPRSDRAHGVARPSCSRTTGADMRAAPIGWGVIGATSQVAQKAVLPAIVASPGARLVAVASARTANGGGVRFAAARAYLAYAALLDDPEVEAVYVPLPNSLHREWVERAAAAGKHVLCEKPLAPTAADGEAMASACETTGVTLLEAYMTPFHPRAMAIETLVASGRLGALRFARAAFTGVLDRRDDHRWRPEMGGGALLDVGIYCLAPLLAAAGRTPARVEASATLAKSGVDVSFAGWLDFGDGFTATIECSFDAPERQFLEIVGTEAAVLVDRAHTPGHEDVAFTLRHRDGRVEAMVAGGGDPYRGMIEHFQAVVRGEVEPRRSCADSVALLTVLERLREASLARRRDHLDGSISRTV